MKTDTATLLKQFEPIDQMYQELNARKKYDDFSNISTDEGNQFLMICLSCLDRVAGEDSSYSRLARKGLERHNYYWSATIPETYGIVQALKQNVAAGYLTTLRELVHADLFADFLEAAEYFLNEGYKDPAAVMVGGVLEEHLRQLCRKNRIDTEVQDMRDATKMNPKKADTMNADLTKANVYGKLEQKQVTAWLDIRNKAAHALYADYSEEQVKLFLQGLRDFIVKYPA